MNRKKGRLYIVATPIGNLSDLSERARSVLGQVSLVLAEDTRRAARLLSAVEIDTRCRSFYDHNEQSHTGRMVELLLDGQDLALISDAGTPLISDPGFVLVKEARRQGIAVTPVPGPNAAIAALSASGLPVDRFVFEGFLPRKPGLRQKKMSELSGEQRTLVFYESSHRIVATLEDMVRQFGASREAVIAREISKTYETFYCGDLDNVLTQIQATPEDRKGEFVILVAPGDYSNPHWNRALELANQLVADMPVRKACKIAAQAFGLSGNKIYQAVMQQREDSD